MASPPADTLEPGGTSVGSRESGVLVAPNPSGEVTHTEGKAKL